MSQMNASDLQVVKAIPGNDKCCDCGMKHPQWASVSFGNVFCLECSGVHRSLGVHISFVRSIAMDSWTPAQIEIMKAGGNDACNEYLFSRGVARTASIREKYSSDAAALYKQVLKARAEKRPEPTTLEKNLPNRSRQSSSESGGGGAGSMSTSHLGGGGKSSSSSSGGGGATQDPNGMERLRGETDAEYIARQTRIREEAKKRMAEKFGNAQNGKRTMGGIGSSPHPSSSSSSSFGGGGGLGMNMDVSSLTNSISSGLGTAASGLSSVFSFASNTVNSSSAREVAKDVGNMGLELWSTISSSAKEVANNLHMEGLNLGGGNNGNHQGDGFSALSEKIKMEKMARGNSSRVYSGFGNDHDAMTSAHSQRSSAGTAPHTFKVTAPTPATTAAATVTATAATGNVRTTTLVDSNSAAPLPGESDADYMKRQVRIREEAQAKASSLAHTKVAASKAATSTPQPPKKTPSVTKMQVGSDDDFFASFGA